MNLIVVGISNSYDYFNKLRIPVPGAPNPNRPDTQVYFLGYMPDSQSNSISLQHVSANVMYANAVLPLQCTDF